MESIGNFQLKIMLLAHISQTLVALQLVCYQQSANTKKPLHENSSDKMRRTAVGRWLYARGKWSKPQYLHLISLQDRPTAEDTQMETKPCRWMCIGGLAGCSECEMLQVLWFDSHHQLLPLTTFRSVSSFHSKESEDSYLTPSLVHIVAF